MTLYFPPVIDDVPTVLTLDQYPPHEHITYRLFGHFRRNNRGRTVILKTDNTAVVVDHPIEQSDANWGLSEIGGVPFAQIARVFRGGHYHEVTTAEQSAIIASGVGGSFT